MIYVSTLTLCGEGAFVMTMKISLPSYNAKTDFIQYKVITHRCVDRKDV